MVEWGMLETDLVRAAEAGSKRLLIALHGLGDSMEGYRWLPQVLRLPGLNCLLVNAPDDYYGGFSWYDFAGNPGPGVERSYKLLEELLAKTAADGFPAEQTMLFGFSQGCLMTMETGLRHGQRLAGCIGVSGYVHEPERLLKLRSAVAGEQSFLWTHGTEDPLIPIDLVRPQIAQLGKAGIKIQFHEFRKEHTMIEPELMVIRRFVCDRLGIA